MSTREAIAKRLYQLCYDRHITINHLSTLAAVPPSTVKNILYGKSNNPGVVTVKMLCDGLGITLGEFFSCPLFDGLEQEIQ